MLVLYKFVGSIGSVNSCNIDLSCHAHCGDIDGRNGKRYGEGEVVLGVTAEVVGMGCTDGVREALSLIHI